METKPKAVSCEEVGFETINDTYSTKFSADRNDL